MVLKVVCNTNIQRIQCVKQNNTKMHSHIHTQKPSWTEPLPFLLIPPKTPKYIQEMHTYPNNATFKCINTYRSRCFQ